MGSEPVPAPRWRQTGAALIDMAALAALSWPARRRPLVRPGGLVSRLLVVAREVVTEQLRTPGQLLLGTRTVDRRTGARVAVWRTVVLTGVRVAGGELTRLLVVRGGPGKDHDREAFLTEMNEVMRTHPQDSPEREAAREELFARHPPVVSSGTSLLRVVAPSLVFGLVNKRLRRRLAPTVEVLAREG